MDSVKKKMAATRENILAIIKTFDATLTQMAEGAGIDAGDLEKFVFGAGDLTYEQFMKFCKSADIPEWAIQVPGLDCTLDYEKLNVIDQIIRQGAFIEETTKVKMTVWLD